MKTEKLILNYQRRGIKLSVSDNKLHFSAPQNILTDEDKDILKKNKKEIIKFLLDHTESEIIVDEEDKYEKFPLTDIQLSYLVGQDNVYKFGGTNCKIYTEIEYEQIELNKAQYAWEQVIKYNDMLHAVINQEGTQEILSSYTVPQIVFSDLSDMENAEVIIAQKRESLTKKQYRVGTWPLFDVEITKLKNKYILHISLDMLVADFVSINVILNEFEEVYYNGKLSFKQQLSFRDIVLYKESLKKTVNGKKKYEDVFKGDIVAVAVSKGVWQIAAVLGILSKGAVYLPLDIHQPSERVDKIIKSAHVKCCILEEDNFISHDLTKKLNIRDIKRKERSGNDYKQINIDIEAPAYVIFTSGSTGNPKGVIISHSAATNTILDINNKFKINSDDRILNISNLSFDLSVYDIFGTFFAGAELVQVNEEQAKDPAHWYDLLKHENISVFNGVPGQMKMLTMFLKGKEKPILDAVRLILLSGDWIPVDLPKEISKYFPNAEIVSLGGATEAAIWSIYYPINIKQNYIRSIPYGKPLANQRFYILNEKGEETLDWISGDIYIAGKGLAIGYLGDPELTEKKFIYSRQLKERLYKTGDIGRYMPDGTIEFQGRSDFQVKIRGHRVELGEIEMAIVEILHPKDLKVITVNNNDVISICMFAVLENESDALSKEELGKYLSEKIPQYMIPVYCEYLSEIPLTVNGKIDIKVLTSRAIEGMKKSRSRGKSEQKLSETEENIYKVWCELFNTTDISVDEDFFECGGDSILVVKLLTELETRYQYKMSLMDVYSSPTIYKMAECITNQQ